MTTRYWIGVASREHVKAAKAGGFCQFCMDFSLLNPSKILDLNASNSQDALLGIYRTNSMSRSSCLSK